MNLTFKFDLTVITLHWLKKKKIYKVEVFFLENPVLMLIKHKNLQFNQLPYIRK